jgi:hypothetical protein
MRAPCSNPQPPAAARDGPTACRARRLELRSASKRLSPGLGVITTANHVAGPIILRRDEATEVACTAAVLQFSGVSFPNSECGTNGINACSHPAPRPIRTPTRKRINGTVGVRRTHGKRLKRNLLRLAFVALRPRLSDHLLEQRSILCISAWLQVRNDERSCKGSHDDLPHRKESVKLDTGHVDSQGFDYV